MSTIDWFVLAGTLLLIVCYGVYKGRTTRNLDGYFLSNREMPWYLVLLGIMGTQASAITFLSAPGQAYTDGMRFVQAYFGLPLAMIVICVSFVPIFHRLKLYTAYEFLEKRFDSRTRTLTSFIFLVSRGLSTGISVYAPSIILSSLLGWNIYITNIVMGGILIIYTVSGGARAVAYTQQLQLLIVFAGMTLAAYTAVRLLPEGIGFTEALHISGKLGKLNVITTGQSEKGFDWTDRYNIFSGLVGGFFLSLAYFGTDQSQVGRYLTARSLKESRLGLLMNGLVKIPMQFLILLTGALVFAFYQFHPSPLFFNRAPVEALQSSVHRDSLQSLELAHEKIQVQKKTIIQGLEWNDGTASDGKNLASWNELQRVQGQDDSLRRRVMNMITDTQGKSESSDTNYIFIRFVTDHLPRGLVGLLIAMIFLAAWGSIAAALNALASATVVDFHKRITKKELTHEDDFRVSRWYTLAWGVFCVIVAQFATGMGSLIEAVNILGSWFYGVILGIFLLAFYFRQIGASAVFWAAIIGQILVLVLYGVSDLGWIWLNVVGAALVVALAWFFQMTVFRQVTEQKAER